MREKGIKNNFQAYLVILTLVSLIMLVVIQISWILKAARFEEQQFNDKVATTMKCVKKELGKRASSCDQMKDYLTGKTCPSVIRKEKIKEIDSIVKSHLANNNIELKYDFSIGDSILEAENNKVFKTKCYLENLNGFIEKDGIRLCIKFPSRNKFIMAQMKGWFVVSIIFIVLIAISFFILLRLFLKEKELLQRTTDFINNMVHEFQTPLANIKLASNLIKKKADKDVKINEYTNVITDETGKLETNVDKILNLACPSRSGSDQDNIDIHQLIREVIEQYRYKIDQKKLKVMLSTDAKIHDLYGDKNQLHLMISNLIDNGLKYSSDEPKLFIETYNKDNHLIIVFRDNGIGIDRKYQPYVFDKYYRVSTGDVHNVKGFGLGLTYVKKIVTIFNGTISLESKPGEGTQFTIKIPLKNG